MRRSRLILIVVAFAVAALAIGSLLMYRQPDRPTTLRLLFTGETLGRLEPCICDGELAGGLAFRSGYLKAQQRPYLLLDVGCMGGGTGPMELLQADAVLRSMADMQYDAANVGEHELAGGLKSLRRLATLGVPLVSANVTDADGAPAVNEWIATDRGGRETIITGLVAEGRYRSGAGLRVMPAREALARLLPRLQGKKQPIVLLADLEQPAVRELAREFPELTAILFRGRNDSLPPERVNRTIIASVYGGRYIADVALRWTAARRVEAEGQAVLLDESLSGEAPRVRTPQGVSFEPPELAFGRFQKGETREATLTLRNHNAAPVMLGRVYSPCTCFVIRLQETTIAPGASVSISVALHSLELAGEQSFPLYFQVSGATEGILVVQASASIDEAAPAQPGETP